MALLEAIAPTHAWIRALLVERELPLELVSRLANTAPLLQAQSTRLLCSLCEGSAAATAVVNSVLASRLELSLSNHPHLPHEGLFHSEL